MIQVLKVKEAIQALLVHKVQKVLLAQEVLKVILVIQQPLFLTGVMLLNQDKHMFPLTQVVMVGYSSVLV